MTISGARGELNDAHLGALGCLLPAPGVLWRYSVRGILTLLVCIILLAQRQAPGRNAPLQVLLVAPRDDLQPQCPSSVKNVF